MVFLIISVQEINKYIENEKTTKNIDSLWFFVFLFSFRQTWKFFRILLDLMFVLNIL